MEGSPWCCCSGNGTGAATGAFLQVKAFSQFLGRRNPEHLVFSQKWVPGLELCVVVGFVACQGAGLGTAARGTLGVAQTRGGSLPGSIEIWGGCSLGSRLSKGEGKGELPCLPAHSPFAGPNGSRGDVHLENIIPNGEKRSIQHFCLCFHIGQRSGQAVLASPGCVSSSGLDGLEMETLTASGQHAELGQHSGLSSRVERKHPREKPCPNVSKNSTRAAPRSSRAVTCRAGGAGLRAAIVWGWMGTLYPIRMAGSPRIAGLLPGPGSDSHLL